MIITVLSYAALALAIVAGIAKAIKGDTKTPSVNEGIKRTGRVGLWVALPPVGLWRSVRHGKRKSEDRLAKKITEELREKS